MTADVAADTSRIPPIHAQIKASMKPTDMRIALLIDCDNVSHNAIEGVLSELAKHGTVNVRHAHGDWKSNNLRNQAKIS
jgi:hypothetical protein